MRSIGSTIPSVSALAGILVLALWSGGCGGRPASSAARAGDADPALAAARLPETVIPLPLAEEAVTEHRWNEWAQIVRVFRWKGDVLDAWRTRQEKWAGKKAGGDAVAARSWLLSGLTPEQQTYWAQWVFYRGRVHRLVSVDADAELQARVWGLARPYAEAQVARGYVAEDPYLREIREEAQRYQAEVDALLDG